MVKQRKISQAFQMVELGLENSKSLQSHSFPPRRIKIHNMNSNMILTYNSIPIKNVELKKNQKQDS